MTILIEDIEANGLDPDVIHVICTKEKETGKKHSFTNMNHYKEYVKDIKPKKHVFHNGLGYDVKVINKLIEPNLIKPKDVIDTQVVSKLVNYKKYRTHSLREIGEALGTFKGDYTGGWDVCTPEMIEYCEQDVEVLESILDSQWKYITDTSWSDSMRTEHDMAWLCQEMQTNGFKFNIKKAEQLLESITKEKDELEESFRKAFSGGLVEKKRLKLNFTKDGKLYAGILKAMTEYPKCEVVGEEVIIYDHYEFNPASPKERIDVLWKAKWKPFEKTEGHKKWLKGS